MVVDYGAYVNEIFENDFNAQIRQLEAVLERDAEITEILQMGTGPKKTRQLLQCLYVNYIAVVWELNQHIDIISIERRNLLASINEAMLGRIVELRMMMIPLYDYLIPDFNQGLILEKQYKQPFVPSVPPLLKDKVQERGRKLKAMMDITVDWEFFIYDTNEQFLNLNKHGRLELFANFEISRQRREYAHRYLSRLHRIPNSEIEFLQEMIIRILMGNRESNKSLSEMLIRDRRSGLEFNPGDENYPDTSDPVHRKRHLYRYVEVGEKHKKIVQKYLSYIIQWMLEFKSQNDIFPTVDGSLLETLINKSRDDKEDEIVPAPRQPSDEPPKPNESTEQIPTVFFTTLTNLLVEYKAKVEDDILHNVEIGIPVEPKVVDNDDDDGAKAAEKALMLQIYEIISEKVFKLQTFAGDPLPKTASIFEEQEEMEPELPRKVIRKQSIISLIKELVQLGIVRYPLTMTVDDFKGASQAMGMQKQQLGIAPLPDVGDIRDHLIVLAIYPFLCGQTVNSPQSFLIVGPPHSGKKTLIECITQTLGGILIDISLSVIEGTYSRDKTGKKMMASIKRIMRECSLVVVMINECETIFSAKKKKKAKKDHKRCLYIFESLRKMKNNGDKRLLIIGTVENPQKVSVEKLEAKFEQIIMMPRPSYKSRFQIWKYLTRDLANFTDSHLITLAQLTDGFCGGHFGNAMAEMFTPQKEYDIINNPVNIDDIVEFITASDYLFETNENVYKQFYLKTRMGKMRPLDEQAPELEVILD